MHRRRDALEGGISSSVLLMTPPEEGNSAPRNVSVVPSSVSPLLGEPTLLSLSSSLSSSTPTPASPRQAAFHYGRGLLTRRRSLRSGSNHSTPPPHLHAAGENSEKNANSLRTQSFSGHRRSPLTRHHQVSRSSSSSTSFSHCHSNSNNHRNQVEPFSRKTEDEEFTLRSREDKDDCSEDFCWDHPVHKLRDPHTSTEASNGTRVSQSSAETTITTRRSHLEESSCGEQKRQAAMEAALDCFRSWEEGHRVSFSGRSHPSALKAQVHLDGDKNGSRNCCRTSDVVVVGLVRQATPPSPDRVVPSQLNRDRWRSNSGPAGSMPSILRSSRFESERRDQVNSFVRPTQPDDSEESIENLDAMEEQEKELILLAIDRSKLDIGGGSCSSLFCPSVDSSNFSLAQSACFSLSEAPPPAPPPSSTLTGGSCHSHSQSTVMSASSNRCDLVPEDFSTSENEERHMLRIALERSLNEPTTRSQMLVRSHAHHTGIYSESRASSSSSERHHSPVVRTPDRSRPSTSRRMPRTDVHVLNNNNTGTGERNRKDWLRESSSTTRPCLRGNH